MGKSVERRPPYDCARLGGDDDGEPLVVLRPPVGNVVRRFRLEVEGGNTVLDAFVVDNANGVQVGAVRSTDGNGFNHRRLSGATRPGFFTIGRATRRLSVVAFVSILVDRVDFPSASIRVNRPYLGLVGVAARFVALNGGNEPGAFEAVDRSLNVLGSVHENAVMRVLRRCDVAPQVKSKLKTGMLRDE